MLGAEENVAVRKETGAVRESENTVPVERMEYCGPATFSLQNCFVAVGSGVFGVAAITKSKSKVVAARKQAENRQISARNQKR